MVSPINWGQTVSTAEKIGVLARKLAAARAEQGPAIPHISPELDAPFHSIVDPAERAWRIALARAARDHMKLALGFENLSADEVGLVEVLETPMERALILMLEGAGDALGLIVISAPILSGMIEMLTLSRLTADHTDVPRSPTRTDAAMVVDMIDAALAAFAQTMSEMGSFDWSQPYRYAAYIEDPRPLHLMLEDGNYRRLRAEVHLENGTRHGEVTLAVPIQSTFEVELSSPETDVFAQDAANSDLFTADFSDQISTVATHLDAVLAQITLPLDRVFRLQVGEVLALSGAGLDSIKLHAIDGLPIALGKLGQQRGMRAIRLNEMEIGLPDLGAAAVPQTILDGAKSLGSGDPSDLAAPIDLMQVG